MPNTAEMIEKLARKLEQQRMLTDMNKCETLEEFKELRKKYEALCEDNNNKTE